MLLYVIYLNGAIELLIAANVILSISKKDSVFYRFYKVAFKYALRFQKTFARIGSIEYLLRQLENIS